MLKKIGYIFKAQNSQKIERSCIPWFPVNPDDADAGENDGHDKNTEHDTQLGDADAPVNGILKVQ